MKFGSVKEYFYKLNNRAYQLMMVPFILFTFFYTQSILNFYTLTVLDKEISAVLFKIVCGISITLLTIVRYT